MNKVDACHRCMLINGFAAISWLLVMGDPDSVMRLGRLLKKKDGCQRFLWRSWITRSHVIEN